MNCKLNNSLECVNCHFCDGDIQGLAEYLDNKYSNDKDIPLSEYKPKEKKK